MTWKIKAVAGPFVGQEMTIDQDKIIGRDPSVDIVLQGGHISRRHAELSIRDNQLWLKDLNSANGTFVNDARITEQQLYQNDELQIDVVRFLVFDTLQETRREKTTESLSLTDEGLPTHISVPKPAPMPVSMPHVQATPSIDAPAATQASVTPDSSAPNSSAHNAQNQAPQKTGFKNTLPAAIGMAVIILLFFYMIWYFVFPH